jgi:hypothetical protein
MCVIIRCSLSKIRRKKIYSQKYQIYKRYCVLKTPECKDYLISFFFLVKLKYVPAIKVCKFYCTSHTLNLFIHNHYIQNFDTFCLYSNNCTSVIKMIIKNSLNFNLQLIKDLCKYIKIYTELAIEDCINRHN